jgi:hypothetical protein
MVSRAPATFTPAMITKAKLDIYKRYQGDIDGWARTNSQNEMIIAEEDWSEIDLLIHQLTVLKNGLVSDDYAARIKDALKSKTEDDLVAKDLLGMI